MESKGEFRLFNKRDANLSASTDKSSSINDACQSNQDPINYSSVVNRRGCLRDGVRNEDSSQKGTNPLKYSKGNCLVG